MDEATGEILAAVVTTNDFKDGQVLGNLLEQIDEAIEQVSTDGLTTIAIATTRLQSEGQRR